MLYRSAINRVPVWLVGLLAAVACASFAISAEVIRKAAGVEGNAGELARFVRACDALVTPGVIAIAAATPLACLVGAGMMMFGSRRCPAFIGGALGTLILVASIKGIIA